MSYANNKEWRAKNPDKRNEGKKRNYSKTARGNSNAGSIYTCAEDTLVLESSLTDRELHSIIGRSVQSIQDRRSRLKKIEIK